MARILIVDDSEDLRKTLTLMLEEERHEILVAGDYETARNTLEQETVDLIICDMALPSKFGAAGTEGETSVETGANAIPEFACDFPTIPIIAISGAISEQKLVGMRRFGAFSVLPKPFTEAQLIKAVNQALATYPNLDDRTAGNGT